jgi:hypothetical protein
MKRIAQKPTMNTVEINGDVFEIMVSDCEVYAEGKKIFAECVSLDVLDSEAVRRLLMRIADMVDNTLGPGSMRRITRGKPVNMTESLNVLNAIVESCTARYAEYIAREYIPRAEDVNAKIQLIRS